MSDRILYATPEEITQFISSNFFSTSREAKYWNSLDDNDKQVFANMMTAFLQSLPYVGRKYRMDQPLALPRFYKGSIIKFNNELMKAAIQSVVYNQESSQGEYSELLGAGIKSYSVEGSSITFQSTSESLAAAQTWMNRVPQETVSVFSKYCY